MTVEKRDKCEGCGDYFDRELIPMMIVSHTREVIEHKLKYGRMPGSIGLDKVLLFHSTDCLRYWLDNACF